ncbi:hypothetical protein MRX96_055142 [Rhipicephalus microplus]
MAACWFSPRPSLIACLLVVLALSPHVAQAFTCSVCNSVYNEHCMSSPEKYITECVPPPDVQRQRLPALLPEDLARK